MLLHTAMAGDWGATRRALADARPLCVLLVDWREPHLALARAALDGAGHTTMGAARIDAALELIDGADVLVLDPGGDDERIVPELAQALHPDAALVLYGNRFEWLGRAGRSITVVPEGALCALLDVVARLSERPAPLAGTPSGA